MALASKTLTRRELAAALPCSLRTLARHIEEGLPVKERGRGGRPSRFDEDEARAWLAAREAAAKTPGGLDWSQERALKEHWQALLAEQMHKAREKDLLPRVEVEKVWSAERDAIRTVILATYTTQADRVHRAGTLDGVAGVERALKEIAYELLRELAGEQATPRAKRRKERVA